MPYKQSLITYLFSALFLFSTMAFAQGTGYSINYMSTTNGAIVGDGTLNTDYFGPNNWGGNYGDCTSGSWRWIHALCSECFINNKDVSIKQNNHNGSTWYAGGGASRYMVIDLSMSRTFNELRVFQMFSDGKVTSIRMYSHIDNATVPIYSDAGWIPVFAETNIGAGVINGDTVSMPTIINFPYTTSRFLLIEAKNDGSLGNATYTEIRELKLFDNDSATPAPIDSGETPIFNQVDPICEGNTLNNLPTTSNNGITGTWSPALNNTTTTEYTFTPNNGQCAESTTMTITVNPAPIEPTTECWETATFNNTSCTWNITGTQPAAPTTECWETAIFNNTTCSWEVIGIQPTEPITECWETATFNDATCTWNISGTQPAEPTTECYETATFNDTTCSWDLTGTQPPEPTTECWQIATFNITTCTWDITGMQPTAPITECWETATFNDTTCTWDITGTQPTAPITECWEIATFNDTTCSWDITGTQPVEPTTECWETTTFNDTTCSWDVTGAQPAEPTTECWETAIFNNTTCSWDISGTQPTEPTTECWQIATFNNTTCSWDITGTQPTEPPTECWEMATFNDTTCTWDVIGTQPEEPTTECWEIATFNDTTCSWDITGTQPAEPTTECWETATFNDTTCTWNITGTQPIEPATECYETATFNDVTCTWDISGTQPQPIDILPDVIICDTYTLPILTSGNYFSSSGGTGIQLNSGDFITSTQTIFIYAENGDCYDESSFTITINESIDFSLTETNLNIDDNDLTVIMDDLSIEYEYAVDGLSSQTNNQFSDLSVGIHTLNVSDINGCSIKTIEFEIVRFKIPKYFTPNNDGSNDTWQVIDTKNSIRTIQIFDRYGKLIRQINPSGQGWDGTRNGHKMRNNDYWYLITLQTGKLIRGHFTLKR